MSALLAKEETTREPGHSPGQFLRKPSLLKGPAELQLSLAKSGVAGGLALTGIDPGN